MRPEPGFPRPLFLCSAALGAALMLGACSRAPIPAPAVLPQRIVLDYRYGWYHPANGLQTLAEIAAQYKRDAGLVGQINRMTLASRPAGGAMVYIPPNNDLEYVKQSLAVIHRDPAIVPRVPYREPETKSAPDLKEVVQTGKADGGLKGIADAGMAPVAATLAPRPALAMARPVLPETARAQPKPSAPGSPMLFDWPAAGKVVTPYRGGWEKACHGIEIAAPQGSPVSAARAGKVLFAREFPGYGKLILIDHGDGFASVYAYLDAMLAREGERVDQGRKIATTGLKGSSPLFFFQIRKQGELVDPMDFLKSR